MTADQVPLFARLVATLQHHGRIVRSDEEILTADISADGSGEPVVAVVLPNAQRVVFYSVVPQPFGAEVLPAVSELVHRMNSELHTACWELNPDSGLLTARTGFEFDNLATLDAEQRATVIWNCLLEVELVAEDAAAALAAVRAGTSALEASRLVSAAA